MRAAATIALCTTLAAAAAFVVAAPLAIPGGGYANIAGGDFRSVLKYEKTQGKLVVAPYALMRRPVAVKVLDASQANETSIARFEREVQLTCQLTHPNTIALYDFGRTPEGLFYYAMEYLDGLSLDALVNKFGRLQK